ncbi:MAG: M50 family metallopeptidase [Eubacteriales bacterium]|nr:M50 family metallopeptidase [Eubacteriales bacterium]
MDTVVTILSYVGALLFVGIIIMVHELGHYSIGRACHIKIVEFAVGFGPKIKQWVKNDIIYSVRWIFLGGFTKFYGEDQDVDDKLAFNHQPAGRRALTIAAGPVFNIAFAFLLVVIVLCAFGDYVPTVSEVWEDSPAEQAGLMAGDMIVEMNGVEMDFYMEVQAAQNAASGESIQLTVLRDGQELEFDIPLQYYEEHGLKAGFTYGPGRVYFGFFEAIALSFKWMFLLLKETLVAILGIFTGKGMENAVGVVGIVDVLGEALRSSFEYVLRLGVAISASLAVFNILPLPALDGGRLVFIGIEKVFKKPVPRNIEGFIHLVGFALFFVLVILITYQDITGNSIKSIFGG